MYHIALSPLRKELGSECWGSVGHLGFYILTSFWVFHPFYWVLKERKRKEKKGNDKRSDDTMPKPKKDCHQKGWRPKKDGLTFRTVTTKNNYMPWVHFFPPSTPQQPVVRLQLLHSTTQRCGHLSMSLLPGHSAWWQWRHCRMLRLRALLGTTRRRFVGRCNGFVSSGLGLPLLGTEISHSHSFKARNRLTKLVAACLVAIGFLAALDPHIPMRPLWLPVQLAPLTGILQRNLGSRWLGGSVTRKGQLTRMEQSSGQRRQQHLVMDEFE